MNTSSLSYFTLYATVSLLAACGDDGQGADPGIVTVYESRGMLQCQTGGLTPQQSGMKLTSAGLDVLRSGCGVVTNVAFPAVCGAGTGDIALHEIRRESLGTAEQQGFSDVETLQNPATGRGYDWIDCDTRAVIR